MIPLRAAFIAAGVAVAIATAAWLRHDGAAAERGRAAQTRAESLTRTEEARRAADAAADRAPGAADELRQHWRRPE